MVDDLKQEITGAGARARAPRRMVDRLLALVYGQLSIASTVGSRTGGHAVDDGGRSGHTVSPIGRVRGRPWSASLCCTMRRVSTTLASTRLRDVEGPATRSRAGARDGESPAISVTAPIPARSTKRSTVSLLRGRALASSSSAAFCRAWKWKHQALGVSQRTVSAPADGTSLGTRRTQASNASRASPPLPGLGRSRAVGADSPRGRADSSTSRSRSGASSLRARPRVGGARPAPSLAPVARAGPRGRPGRWMANWRACAALGQAGRIERSSAVAWQRISRPSSTGVTSPSGDPPMSFTLGGERNF